MKLEGYCWCARICVGLIVSRFLSGPAPVACDFLYFCMRRRDRRVVPEAMACVSLFLESSEQVTM